jgi:hypothetical protein
VFPFPGGRPPWMPCHPSPQNVLGNVSLGTRKQSAGVNQAKVSVTGTVVIMSKRVVLGGGAKGTVVSLVLANALTAPLLLFSQLSCLVLSLSLTAILYNYAGLPYKTKNTKTNQLGRPSP